MFNLLTKHLQYRILFLTGRLSGIMQIMILTDR